MAILALGGYGRRELCLFSDVDLLFAFKTQPRAEEEEVVRSCLYPLWDISLDLGHAVRSEKAALDMVGQDLDSTTALVENRLLAGNEEFRNQLTEKLRRKLHSPKGAKWYMEAKLADWHQRHKKHGHSIYVLEPHLKEGCGTLRDLHGMLWLSFVVFGSPTLEILNKKGILSVEEVRRLNKAWAFLLTLRNTLHAVEQRKTDHLTFERQVKVAEQLGYKSRENALAEEQLMRAFYARARDVERLSTRSVDFLQRHAPGRERKASGREARRIAGGPFFLAKGNELYVEERHRYRFRKEPDLIMKAFSLAAGLGLRVRQDTRDWIANSVAGVKDSFRTSPVNRDLFLGILRGPANVFHTLHDMHECGALGAFLPEFDSVRHLPRIDFYHQYTVDEHLLLGLKYAEELRVGRPVREYEPGRPNGPSADTPDGTQSHVMGVARGVKRWDLLNLSLLLHDVGKGEGRGHVIRGAHIMERIAERMGLPEQDRDICHRLVRNHQKMSHLAQRRNVEDPKVAQELARELEDREILRMLYVLTACDLKSVAANVWNDWKSKLLASLYERAIDCLYATRPLPAHREAKRAVTPEKVLDALSDQGRSGESRTDVEKFLAGMPERYLVSTPARDMAQHYLLARGLSHESAVHWRLEAVADRKFSELTVAALDSPGIFSHICGALASRGINILAAQIYTATHGVCIDVFHIQDQRGEPVEPGGWFDRLERKLGRVLAGQQEEEWRQDTDAWRLRKYLSLMTPDRLAIRPSSIEFNNSASAQYTVIEIKTHDRPGLLYSITRVMDEERINIDLALIATEAYRVVDVFYVTDWDNNKLEGETRLNHLRASLLRAIEGGAALPGETTRAAESSQGGSA
jgi:[protein-PII] uridylyltransferase